MDNNRIYHGSNMVVMEPRIVINGHYKDFGYGFYCTNIEKQALVRCILKGVRHYDKYVLSR